MVDQLRQFKLPDAQETRYMTLSHFFDLDSN